MLGTLADAQDVVQETYLKWRDADLATVREPRAWLVTVCSRLAINAMKSAFAAFPERLRIINGLIKPRYALLNAENTLGSI